MLLLTGCDHEVAPPTEATAEANAAEPTVEREPESVAAREVLVVPPAPARGPWLRATDLLWQWGTAPAGQDLRHTFLLHNDGDESVRIRKARPT